MLVGAIARDIGACPRCGVPVPLHHMARPGHLLEAYRCPSCGPTVYGR